MRTRILRDRMNLSTGRLQTEVIFTGSHNAYAVWRKNMAPLAGSALEQIPDASFFSDLTSPEKKPEKVFAPDQQLEHFNLRPFSVIMTRELPEIQKPSRVRKSAAVAAAEAAAELAD